MFRAYKFIKELIGDYFKFTNSQKSKEFCIKKGIEDVYRLKEQTIAFSEILIENPSQIIERNSMGFPPEKIYLPILELNGINTNKSLTTLCELDYDEKLYVWWLGFPEWCSCFLSLLVSHEANKAKKLAAINPKTSFFIL